MAEGLRPEDDGPWTRKRQAARPSLQDTVSDRPDAIGDMRSAMGDKLGALA